jgi:hypothetical protein
MHWHDTSSGEDLGPDSLGDPAVNVGGEHTRVM